MSDPPTHPHVFVPERPTGCQAFSNSTREQCGIYWISHDSCNVRGHKQQKEKCHAVTREKKVRCLGSITNAGGGYFCEMHEDWATPDEVVCRGFKVRDGPKCNRRAFGPDYPFCMTKHDPRLNYCDPNEFRVENLRADVLGPLRKRDGYLDLYNPGRTTRNVDLHQVDHRVEMQMFGYFCQFNIFANAEEKRDVMMFARDEFANTLFNLLVTEAATNQGKGEGVAHFLEDLTKFSLLEYGRLTLRSLKDIRRFTSVPPIVVAFDDRLREQQLGRKSTKAIRREMGESLRRWQYKCLDQGETVVYEKLGKMANEAYTVFDLHTGTDLD